MPTKKSLYKPAPDVQLPPTSATLCQGSELDAVATPVPTIKQGILDKKQSEKYLSSTLKSSKGNNGGTKPVVVCHKPAMIHAAMAVRNPPGGELVTDTVSAPLAVSITDASTRKLASDINSKTETGTKKKVKARFVESRYLKPASGQHLRNDTSGSSNNSSCLSKTNKSRRDLQGSYSTQTPTTGAAPGKTSTPFSKASGQQLFDWNASAIERNQSYVGPSRGGVTVVEAKTAVHGETGILDPQLIYLRYLQWHSRSKKTTVSMGTKAKEISAEIKFLHDKVGSLRSQNEELERQEKAINNEISLEKQLQTQGVCLGPILEKIGSCLDEHSTLVSNLDTTRHNLALNGVSDPDPDVLEHALEETRNLLGQVNILMHSQAPAISTMSEGSHALDSRCKEEAELIQVAQKLVFEELSSTLKQASLVAQLQGA